jgi:hypothetical protein
VRAWFDRIPLEQRGPLVVGIMLLGLIVLPPMLITVVVLARLLVRLRQGRRSGTLHRVVRTGVGGLHVVFGLARRALMKRLRRALADVGGEPGR